MSHTIFRINTITFKLPTLKYILEGKLYVCKKGKRQSTSNKSLINDISYFENTLLKKVKRHLYFLKRLELYLER